MKKKCYKVFTKSNKIVNFDSGDEVVKFLGDYYGISKEKLKLVEVFDPVTGWDYADTWLQIHNRKKQNLEKELTY
ncbi:MAG: hypothetical protein JEY94_05700 [Melioribacteraceae bacterium]|nr:hypothetical protein [Melioribacteraceae bacterium]